MLFENATSFIPHGYCLSWSGPLIGLVAGSHLLIGLSYLSIPVALYVFARRHPELNQKLIFGLFSAFILGCGATHLIELVNIWVPFYRIDSLILGATAIVSVVTAALIWPITRQATAALKAVDLGRQEQAAVTNELFQTILELKQSNLKLDESERRFRLSVEYAPNGQGTVDLDGRWLMVNQSLCKMLGYDESELLGKKFQDITHPDDLERDLQNVQDLLQGRAVSYRMEKRYISKSTQAIHVQLDVALLRTPEGMPLHFVVQIQDITQRKHREAYTQHVALHDSLTGLPNRALLNDRIDVAIEAAKRHKKKVGVMMLDLDHFKKINDTLGHHIGDELLKVVAERLRNSLRKSDTAARMGGDEFIVVTPDMNDSKDCDLIANMLVKAISAPIQIGMHQLTITPSIGVSCFPDDGEDGSTLIKYADAAMYQTKAAGRQGHKHFDAEAQAVAQRMLMMEADLRLAIANHHLQVHYQPQICLKTGRIIGVEALARWIDPVKGMISPEQFIPVAEESGLIIPLGEFVLRTACRDARILQKRAGHPLIMAVNISARQFKQDTMIDTIQDILRETGMDPNLLELELTEGVMMESDEKTRGRMQNLRDLGISLAVDDFGTGYSSLSYLTQFPITTLKIDRSFVDKMITSERDAAVVQAIIAMACSLKTKVVAEGVETREQLEFLQEHVCHAAQGFLLGAPSDVDQFSAQGYKFSKPVSMLELAQTFDQIEIDSTASVTASLH